jgi:fumarate reductase flavoprotein subunit
VLKQLKRGSILLFVLIMIIATFSGCTSAPASQATSSETASQTETVQTTEAGVHFTSGTYSGEAKGKESTIAVNVTFSDDAITDIEIVGAGETAGIGDEALEKVKSQIIQYQSLNIDAVSGATETSNGLIEAVSSAVEQAGGNEAVAKLQAAEVPEVVGETLSLDADVVVIGAGASGVSAAVSAADEGAKVILIEKTATIGGASNLSWAGKFYNSSVALESGVQVEVEKEISDWIVNNHWRVDAAAIRQYVTQSGATYDWLASKGYQTTFINFFGEQLHMLPAYETRQGLLRTMLADSVEAGGGAVYTETTGKSLMTDDQGNVVGVIAKQADGTVLEISAKSVVMATGGYAANAEMVKELFGFEGINGGLGQNVGEGLEMAWAVGAKVPDNIGGQMLHQTLARATSDLKEQYSDFEASYPLMTAYLPNFMNVGPSGARFRDETATLTAVAAANTSAFNGPFHYVIISASQLKALEAQGMNGVSAPSLPGMPPEFYVTFRDQFALDTPWSNVQEVFDAMVADGNGYKGDTPEELAQNAEMDVEVFKEAFDQYQEAIQSGVDTAFGKNAAYLTDMGTEGPYYAVIAEINNLGSVGGLLVNTKFEVLDDNRIPIDGLYAVGLESEGVLFNDTYVGNGVGLGYAFTSGRLGGVSAADHALGE